ncbi:MAG: STAS/SEC14 domain-containing protein [Bacteroidales bacterium]
MDEYNVGTNKVVIREDRIVHITVIGEQDDAIAQGFLDFHEKAHNIVGGKIRYLIDINQTGKASPMARRVYKQLGEMETTERVALYGAHPLAKLVGNMVLSTFARNEAKFFNDEKSALQWIRRENT